MAHQLTLVIRYVLDSGESCERFLKFLPSEGHKAEEMFSADQPPLAFYVPCSAHSLNLVTTTTAESTTKTANGSNG